MFSGCRFFLKTTNVLFKMLFKHIIVIQPMLLFIHCYATTKIMDIFCTTLAMLLLVKTLTIIPLHISKTKKDTLHF